VATVALMAVMGGCTGLDEPVVGPVPVVAGDLWERDATYICRRAKGSITVDDRLHPEQWTRAMVITDYLIPISKQPARDQTQMRMLWDDEHLYVHFVAYDRDLRGTFTGKTDPIWTEDAVEVFFQPDPQDVDPYAPEPPLPLPPFDVDPGPALFNPSFMVIPLKDPDLVNPQGLDLDSFVVFTRPRLFAIQSAPRDDPGPVDYLGITGELKP